MSTNNASKMGSNLPASSGGALNESALITVSGDLVDLILQANANGFHSVSSLLSAELSQESVDWHRSYDKPVKVFLDANLVALDEYAHFLAPQILSACVANATTASAANLANTTTTTASNKYSSAAFNRLATNVALASNLSGSTTGAGSGSGAPVRRNHSFNVIRRTPSSSGSLLTTTDASSHHNAHSSPAVDQLACGKTMTTLDANGKSQCEQLNMTLVPFLAERFLRTNGSPVLLHSYWLDGMLADLEAYHQKCREPLLDWFDRILANSAANRKLGLTADFELDCAIIVVIGRAGTRANTTNTTNELHSDTSLSANYGEKNCEQVLSLDRLVADTSSPPATPTRNMAPPSTPQRSTTNTSSRIGSVLKQSLTLSAGKASSKLSLKSKGSGTSLGSALSSSLSSLNSSSGSNLTASLQAAASTNQLAASSPLTIAQLLEQIINDLCVQYQLFVQKQSATNLAGNFANTLAAALTERMVVFDYATLDTRQTSSGACGATPSNTPISRGKWKKSSNSSSKSSNMSTSAASVRITTPAMMLSSPAKSSPVRGGVGSSAAMGPSLDFTGLDTSTLPIVTFAQLTARIRSLALGTFTRWLECVQLLVRWQREMRALPDWDFFAYFLLQEEMALGYESLGLFHWALLQYDELDLLFAQCILAANATSPGLGVGTSGRVWLRRRLLDHSEDEDEHDQPNAMGQLPLSARRRTTTTTRQLYCSWNGLCLCNPQSINSLRRKIVHCLLASYGPDSIKYESQSSPSATRNSTGGLTPSLGPDCSTFGDPLGVNASGPGCKWSHRSVSTAIVDAHSQSISLIDFRNYLFARQCHLLCMLNKPWELASRALPFLHTCVTELNILEISIAPGGLACWIFLSVLEILHKCERYSDSSQLESYSYHTVGLWSYARDKLAELGKLCNLMPGSIDVALNHSDHLHRMVELIAGMGADPHVRLNAGQRSEQGSLASGSSGTKSPQERLKDALSSPKSFLRNYLEITELTMGTYKHIGYIRYARMIGKQLSELYLQLNKPQQALPFLLDHYNLFQAEQWSPLRIEVCKLLARCLEALYVAAHAGSDQNNLSQKEESPEPTLNLEATVRSAFRTYLLLLVGDDNRSGSRDQIVGALRRLLAEYSVNGTQLARIAQRLQLCSELWQQRTATNLPLLTIHNSHSDLFYHSYQSSSTSSLTTLGSSSNSLDRNLNSGSGGADCSLDIVPATGCSSPGGGSTSSSSVVAHHLPAAAARSARHREGEHFVTIEAVQIWAVANTPAGDHYLRRTWSGAACANSTPDKSFIAGSKLRMRLCVRSKLSVPLELDHVMVSMLASRQAQLGGLASARVCACSGVSASSLNSTTSNESLHCACALPPNWSQHSDANEPLAQFWHARAHMQSFHDSSGAGLKCTNTMQVLSVNSNAKNGDSECSSAMPGKLKYLQQVPVSLLNRRLADDRHNFRHYRFVGSTWHFEHSNEPEQQQSPLVLKPALNTFELLFHSPHHFATDQSKPQVANQLWFHLDQLVLFCRAPSAADDQSKATPQFAIVEDFAHTSTGNSATFFTDFRLVKCPPTVELIADEDEESNQTTDSISAPQQQHPALAPSVSRSHMNSLLIGCEHRVTLRLNSGTEYLPKGLRCYLKIVPSCPSLSGSLETMHSSEPWSSSQTNLAHNMHQRLVEVTLHQPTNRTECTPTSCTSPLSYFELDRAVDPFETYQVALRLRSSFTHARVLPVNQSPAGTGGARQPPLINIHELALIVSWTRTAVGGGASSSSGTSSNSGEQSPVCATCHLTLYEPLQVSARLHTCGRRKLFEIVVRAAAELAHGARLLRIPRAPDLRASCGSVVFKPLARSSSSFLLKPDAQLHLVWQIAQADDLADSLQKCSLLLDFATMPAGVTQQAEYLIRFGSDFRTRYLVRETIEQLGGTAGGASSSANELLRVGQACQFRVLLERLAANTSIPNECQPQPPELLMYELMYDTDVWAMCVASRTHTLIPSQNTDNCSGYDSLNSTACLSLASNSTTYESLGTLGSAPESIRSSGSSTNTITTSTNTCSLPSLIDYNICSKVVKLSATESRYEACFEMTPLVDGYLPLPLLRLSRYLPCEASKDQPVPNTTNKQTCGTSSSSNMIESLSAKWTENLNLGKTSWTSKLLPSKATPSKSCANQAEQAKSSVAGKLVPFEPGQVYHCNRASQIYVLPPAVTQAQQAQQPGDSMGPVTITGGGPNCESNANECSTLLLTAA